MPLGYAAPKEKAIQRNRVQKKRRYNYMKPQSLIIRNISKRLNRNVCRARVCVGGGCGGGGGMCSRLYICVYIVICRCFIGKKGYV